MITSQTNLYFYKKPTRISVFIKTMAKLTLMKKEEYSS